MKILKIAFKNINSLKGEHHIDFTKEPFLQNSLFAITGPTGSGKTTILDVISLALFDEVPRLGSIKKNDILSKGAILTRNQKEAFAQITYQCNKGVFTSTWTISTARTGNLRDYFMEIIREDGKILDLKKSDVPAENEKLIGLNYEQFIKSVVLAQGEFAKFLQVPKKERGALLEKITGTEIYRRIGQEAFLKNKENNKLIEEKESQIKVFKEQLLEEEDFQIQLQKEEKLKAEKKLLSLSIEKITDELKLKEKLQQQEQQLQETKKSLEKVAVKKNVFEKEKGEQLKQHQEIEWFAEDLNLWKNLQKDKHNKEVEAKNHQEKIKIHLEKRNTLAKEIYAKFQLEITPEIFTEKMELYKQKIRKLIEERNELGSTYRTSAKHIEQIGGDLKFNSKISDLIGFQEELQTKQTQKSNVYKNLEQKFQLQEKNIKNWQVQLQQQLKENRLAEKEEMEIIQLQNELKRQTKTLNEVENTLKSLPETVEKLQQQLKLKEAQREAKQKTLEVEQLQKQLQDYRKDLVANEACPLCGSVHHPYSEEFPKTENHLKEEVKTLELELKSLNKEVIQKETQLQQYLAQQKELMPAVASLQKTLIAQQEEFQKKFKQILVEKGENSFSDTENLLEKQLQELAEATQLEEELVQLKNLKTQTKELAQLVENGRKKSEEISVFYKGKDFEKEISSAQTSWLGNEQSISQYEQLLKNVHKNLAELSHQTHQLNEKLLQNLNEKGYASIESALKVRLAPSVAQAWAKEKEELQHIFTELTTIKKKLVEEIEIYKEKESEESWETLNEKLQGKRTSLEENEKQFNITSRLVENHRENSAKIKGLQKEIDTELEASQHWKILNELIGDATGNKFNDFAQNLTLTQLLMLANKRLELLSDRYLIDQPSGNEDDSLVAIDKHMGGQRRSIKTLSGGETFILSLALALALSDLASRNIEINSLFIDEGFGTLDPETLDQTLDTLEVLQAESSKMIGVISHVDSLKERIATQIQLTQNGQGYSSLRII